MSEEQEKKQQLMRALVSVDKSTVFEILNTDFTERGSHHVADTLQQALEEIDYCCSRPRLLHEPVVNVTCSQCPDIMLL